MEVGKVEYVIEAKTGQLIEAERRAARSVDNISSSMKKMGNSSHEVNRVAKSIDDMGKEAQNAHAPIDKLQKTLLAFGTVTAGLQLASIADNYRTMGERVEFATQSSEEYVVVQQRLLKVANEMYRPLEEIQEVFIGTSDNLRELGFSLDETLDVTSSLTSLFVKNATSTDKARSALKAYDSALNKGNATAMDWYSINSAIPTLAKDIAEQFGMTITEVLELGNAGKLSSSIINETMLKTAEANRKAATEMKTSVNDAIVSMKNNISVYIGETNKAIGVTDLIASAIDGFGKNIETISKLLLVAGAGSMSKYILSVGLMTAAKMKSALASRAQIAAELEVAKANEAQALAAMKSAQANRNLGGAHRDAGALALAHAKATAEVVRVQALSTSAMRGLLSMLGGPAGIIGLLVAATSSFFLFKTETKETKGALDDLSQPLDELIGKFKEMNALQQENKMLQYQDEVVQKTKKVSEAYQELGDKILEVSRKGDIFASIKRTSATETDMIRGLKREIEETLKVGGDALAVVNAFADKMKVNDEVRRSWIKLAAEIEVNTIALNTATTAINTMAVAQEEAKKQIIGTTAEIRAQKEALAGVDSAADTYLKSLRETNLTLSDGGSAVKEATRKIGEWEKSYKEAGKTFNKETKDRILEQARIKDSYKSTVKSVKSSVNEVANTIKSLEEELYLASLSGKELAIARAEQKLGDFATQQEVEAVRALAVAIYDLNEAKKFGDTKKDQDKYISGDPKALSGGEFDEQLARYEQEKEIEEQRYADVLERLKQARELQLQTNEEFNALELQEKERHEKRMKQISDASLSVLLKSYGSTFGALADIMKNSQGEQSGAYKAMFAVSKAFAIAQAGLKIQEAIAQVMADPTKITLETKLAAYATIASAGAGLLATIQGSSFGGGRQYGGAVNADKMYRINETGQPEIFNAAGGKQYFLPNTRGDVVPAGKNNGAQSQGTVTVNLIESPDRGGEVEQTSDDSGAIINIFVADIIDGGDTSQVLESTYGLRRMGR